MLFGPRRSTKCVDVLALGRLHGKRLEILEICSAISCSQTTNNGSLTGHRSRRITGGRPSFSWSSTNTWSNYIKGKEVKSVADYGKRMGHVISSGCGTCLDGGLEFRCG